MAIFGFGGAFIIAIVSLIFNFSVSAKPLYFFLKDFITFLIQNIINLFDKEKPFVKLTLEHPKYEKMYLYVLSGFFIFVGTFLLFFYGFGSSRVKFTNGFSLSNKFIIFWNEKVKKSFKKK